MRSYPLYLECALRLSRAFAIFFPSKSLRAKVRSLPFALAHRAFCRFQKDTIQADIFISLGEACKPALHLRNYGLRKLSSPLDWMMCYDLDEAYRCFEVGFSDFFEKCYEESQKSAKERWVVSTSNTGMVSIHAFPKSIPLNQYLPTFRKTMQRRFDRLKSKILACDCVAFVCGRTNSIEELADFGKKISKLFERESKTRERERENKPRIIIINIRHKENIPKNQITKEVLDFGENLQVVEFICDDTSINEKKYFLGNTLAWHTVMLNLRLS